eukprot:Skav225683  [mRNA]  locus=scaffold243:31919:37874:- [translate_table: standard]
MDSSSPYGHFSSKNFVNLGCAALPQCGTMKRPAAAMTPEPMKLYYFPLMAKGLGPALESGKCAFGQLPLLEVSSSLRISQCVAIVNYIGKISGTEGTSLEEFAVSQALLAEGEDCEPRCLG